MSKTDETFESAFPHNFVDNTGGPDDGDQIIAFGMALRDYFAAKALAALVTIAGTNQVPKPVSQLCADAYSLADAMLAERDK